MDLSPNMYVCMNRHTDGQQVHEKCSSVSSRKMQIKNIGRYHLLVAMTYEKDKSSVGDHVEKGNSPYSVGRNVNW